MTACLGTGHLSFPVEQSTVLTYWTVNRVPPISEPLLACRSRNLIPNSFKLLYIFKNLVVKLWIYMGINYIFKVITKSKWAGTY